MQSLVTHGNALGSRERNTARGGSSAAFVGLLPDAVATQRPGTMLAGRYRLNKLLGRGGHGLVFQAHDRTSGGDVAVKLLTRTDDDPAHARRFLREAEILGQLHHPNTVRVLDTGQSTDGTMFLVMERVHGQSLEATLRQRLDQSDVLSEQDTTAIALQVLGSLAEAHALGLVHRDIKPSNIMLDEKDGQVRAKVLDFGIAQTQESSLTATGKVMGTPTYMSPEQCLGVELDGRSDLYALAALMYRCVSGHSPFDDPNALTVMYNHVNVPPRDLASVTRTALSAGFVDVVMRGLAKAPEQRFAHADAMRRVLERASEAPADVPVGSLVTRTASPLRLSARPVEKSAEQRLSHPLKWTGRAVPWLIALGCAGLLVAGRTWPTAAKSGNQAAISHPSRAPDATAAAQHATLPTVKPTPAEVTTAPPSPADQATEGEPKEPPVASAPRGTRAHAPATRRIRGSARRATAKDDPTSIVPPD